MDEEPFPGQRSICLILRLRTGTESPRKTEPQRRPKPVQLAWDASASSKVIT